MNARDQFCKPTEEEMNAFLAIINFKLPKGFIDFFKGTHTADIATDKNHFLLWPFNNLFLWSFNNMIQLNKEYSVAGYTPDFFIFGSDGGDRAFAIKKKTGYVFEMPFIGMSNEGAIFKSESFQALLERL